MQREESIYLRRIEGGAGLSMEEIISEAHGRYRRNPVGGSRPTVEGPVAALQCHAWLVGGYLGRAYADDGSEEARVAAIKKALAHVDSMKLPNLPPAEELRAALEGESSGRTHGFDLIHRAVQRAQVYAFLAFAFAVAASPRSVSSLAEDDLNALAWAWSREIAQSGNPILTMQVIDAIYRELDRLRPGMQEPNGGSSSGEDRVLRLLIDSVEQRLNA